MERPDYVSCGAAMGACVKVREWLQSNALLGSMKFYSLSTDISNFNIAVSGSKWRPALQLLGCEERGLKPNGRTISNAIQVLADSSCWKDSFELIDRLSVFSVGTDPRELFMLPFQSVQNWTNRHK